MKISKNTFYEQEIAIEEKSLKMKIFNYFYFIYNGKKAANTIILYILHILEITQLLSYAFTQPHLMTWKISNENIQKIKYVTGSLRIAPLMKFLQNKIYEIIFFSLLALNFVFTLFIIIQILFRKSNSKIYNRLLIFTHLIIDPLTIFLYIPFIEIFLSPIKCIYTSPIPECMNKIQILYVILGIISAICFFFSLIFLNYFYFYPFQIIKSTIKLNSFIDIILMIIKLIFILRIIFIKNEYISIIILLLCALFLGYEQIQNKVYNINELEILLNLRNYLIIWTYFMLLVAKLCYNTNINGLIYLLVLGYPIIIFCSIITYKEYETEFDYKNSSFNNIMECIAKTRFLNYI